MAVNRENPYLGDAIFSVLNQSDPDFKFYIIANNCTDDLWNYLCSFEDPRIILQRTSIGQLSYNLNVGLDLIEHGYVLRMDADDISLPDRLSNTKLCLESNRYPHVLVGKAIIIDGFGVEVGSTNPPLTHKDIVNILWKRNPICHPAVAYQAEAIIKLRGYSGGFVSEDYELWVRARRSREIRFVGSKCPVLKYRVHDDQARGNPLAYAEAVGFLAREFLISFNFLYLIGAGISALKYCIRTLRIA